MFLKRHRVTFSNFSFLMFLLSFQSQTWGADLNEAVRSLRNVNIKLLEIQKDCHTLTRACDSSLRALRNERDKILQLLPITGSFICEVTFINGGEGSIKSFTCKNEIADYRVSNLSVKCTGADSGVQYARFCYEGKLFPRDVIRVDGTFYATTKEITIPVVVGVGGLQQDFYEVGPVKVTLQ